MEINKLLALAQHLDIPYIEDDEENYYFGATQTDYDEYINSLEDEAEPFEVSEWIITQDGYIDFENEVEITDDMYEYEGNEYLILDDGEADQQWSDQIDSYIDECVLPEIPENYRGYFDNESFKSDCEIDGRGHTLSPYDGIEIQQTVNMCDYYLYRTN